MSELVYRLGQNGLGFLGQFQLWQLQGNGKYLPFSCAEVSSDDPVHRCSFRPRLHAKKFTGVRNRKGTKVSTMMDRLAEELTDCCDMAAPSPEEFGVLSKREKKSVW